MTNKNIAVEEKYVVHTDGGSRGNPGPSAIGVVIADYDGSLKKEYAEYIGEATNNEAEYRAVIFALKKLKQLIGKERAGDAKIEFHLDSELAVKQLNKEYKLMDKNIQRFFIEIWNLSIDFGGVSFRHVPREENKEADRLVNAALDKELDKLF